MDDKERSPAAGVSLLLCAKVDRYAAALPVAWEGVSAAVL
jgi:hypothetical protein